MGKQKECKSESFGTDVGWKLERKNLGIRHHLFSSLSSPFRKALLTAQRKEPQQANTSMERASGFVSCKEISLWEKN
jgi:hypothetical protein